MIVKMNDCQNDGGQNDGGQNDGGQNDDFAAFSIILSSIILTPALAILSRSQAPAWERRFSKGLRSGASGQRFPSRSLGTRARISDLELDQPLAVASLDVHFRLFIVRIEEDLLGLAVFDQFAQ
jgi:hypothetical protein